MGSLEARADDQGVVWLSGEFDMNSLLEFRAVTEATLDGQREVVLDISDLAFLDSSGIREIIALAGRVGGKGVLLRHPRPNVRRVLDLVDVAGRNGIRFED